MLQQLAVNVLFDTGFERNAHLPLQLHVLLQIVLDNFAHWWWYAQECCVVHVVGKKSTYITRNGMEKMASHRLNLKPKMPNISMWQDNEKQWVATWVKHVQRKISLSAWIYMCSHYEGMKMTQQQGSMSFTIKAKKRPQPLPLSPACRAYVVEHQEGILLESRFCAHGEMFDYLNEVLEGFKVAPSVSEALQWIEHLKESLAALHEQGFFIGDIKTENMVLCGPRHEPFIIDIDMMHHVPESTLHLGSHTRPYTPIEVQLFLQATPKPIFTKTHWVKFRRFVDTAQIYVVFGMILHAAGVRNKWINAGFEIGADGIATKFTPHQYLHKDDDWFKVPVTYPQGLSDEEKRKVDQILATADELLIHADEYVKKPHGSEYTDDKLKSMLSTATPPILSAPGLIFHQSPLESSDTCVMKFVPEKYRKLLNVEQFENIHWPRYVIPVHQVWPVKEVSQPALKKPRVRFHQYVRKGL